jgi:hypothetical protein
VSAAVVCIHASVLTYCTRLHSTPMLQNPAVLRYDPTGLRSAMSATWAEMDKSLEQYRVSHTIQLSCSSYYLINASNSAAPATTTFICTAFDGGVVAIIAAYTGVALPLAIAESRRRQFVQHSVRYIA